jgi:hypothetical protein
VPVNKRHLDMVYSHIKYSDRAFMGSVTAESRAEDSIDMARIVFGARLRRQELRHPRQCQRQLAAGLGRDHDHGAARLCRANQAPSSCPSSSAAPWGR